MSRIPSGHNSDKDKEEVQAWCLLQSPRVRSSVSDGKIKESLTSQRTLRLLKKQQNNSQFPDQN